MAIVVGLDLGKRCIGVAVVDDLGLAAHPLTVIERRSEKEALRELKTIVNEYGAQLVVAGLPLNMDGSVGPAARYAQDFANRLETALGVPVVLVDERLSTFEAKLRMAARAEMEGKKKIRSRSRLHAHAAAVILENWLATHKTPKP